MQPEHIDLTCQVADQSCCDVRHFRSFEIVRDHGQVAAQLGGGSVNAGGDRGFVMVPIGRAVLSRSRVCSNARLCSHTSVDTAPNRHSDQTRRVSLRRR